MGSGRCERQRFGPAEAGTCTGDDRNLASEYLLVGHCV
jgi:hypothetical protein